MNHWWGRRWAIWGGLAGAGALLSAGWADTAQGTGQEVVLSGRATSMAQERQALKDAQRQSREAQIRSEQLEAQAAVISAEAEKARTRAAALAARIQQSEADIRAGQAHIAILAQLQRVQAAKLAEKRAPVVRLLAALQNVARRPSIVALMQPGSLQQAVHVRAVLATTLPVIEQRTAGLRADMERSRYLRAMAEKAGRAMQASRTKLAEQQGQLRSLEAERRIAARGLASNASLEAERATGLGEKARDISELMTKLEEAGDVRDRLASLPGPELRPATPGKAGAPRSEQSLQHQDSPPYRLPVVGAVVTGMGELSESGVRSRGITIAAQPLAQVIAPANGHVAFAGYYRGFGQIVIIDHGVGWTTLLTNLAHLSVTTGQAVRQGEPIGTAGRQSPNITVELRRNGRPVDVVALVQAG